MTRIGILIFIAEAASTSCCKDDKQEQIVNLSKVKMGDFNLLDIGCSKFYTYYFSTGTAQPIKVTTVLKDTFNTDIFSSITYQITYKKIGVDKCNTFQGIKDYEIVEILSAKRD